jgi:tetratricopeptide (TPR) repeat protein
VRKVTEAKVTKVKVTVRDRDKVLRGVVDEKSAVKLGPMAVPLKPLFDALARLSPKQYLSSSLHRSGKSLILLATLSHGGGNWRIERVIPDQPTEQDKADKLNEMFDELVYRVFAAIGPTGSRDWRAVQRYTEGLRSYGETLTSDMECDRKLWEAANKFLVARGFDKTFARCSYNLGAVYIGLEKWDAAQAMFERALTEDSTSADAAYALALHHLQKAETTANRLERVRALEYTEQAITIDRTDARPWDVKGRICRQLHPDPESTLAWRSSLKFHEKAAALAWRDLCRAAWQVKERDAQHRGVLEAQRSALDPWRKALVIPFRNLGVANLKAGYVNSAISILRQAISQQPDEDLYFQLSKGLFEKKDFRKASVAYLHAVNTAKSPQDRARYQAHIAVAWDRRQRRSRSNVGSPDGCDTFRCDTRAAPFEGVGHGIPARQQRKSRCETSANLRGPDRSIATLSREGAAEGYRRTRARPHRRAGNRWLGDPIRRGEGS